MLLLVRRERVHLRLMRLCRRWRRHDCWTRCDVADGWIAWKDGRRVVVVHLWGVSSRDERVPLDPQHFTHLDNPIWHSSNPARRLAPVQGPPPTPDRGQVLRGGETSGRRVGGCNRVVAVSRACLAAVQASRSASTASARRFQVAEMSGFGEKRTGAENDSQPSGHC